MVLIQVKRALLHFMWFKKFCIFFKTFNSTWRAHLILPWQQEPWCWITTQKPRVQLLSLCTFNHMILWQRRYLLNISWLNEATSLGPSPSQIRCDIRENSVDVPLLLSHLTKLLMIDYSDHACCVFKHGANQW